MTRAGLSPVLNLLRLDGNFYGATELGGPTFIGKFSFNNYGTVFRMTPDGALSNLFSFNGTNGYVPTALIQSPDGNLYGTTSKGGPQFRGSGGDGTVFRLTTNGVFTTLAVFNRTNGSSPLSLMQAADGNFYGTTSQGGSNLTGTGYGTIFKMTPAGKLTSLFSFNGTNGASPRYGPLVQAADGSFYGTTYLGGESNRGTIFRFDIAPSRPPVHLEFQTLNNQLVLSWTNANFTLQSAPAITGPFNNIPGATSPYTNSLTAPQQFFRLAD